MKTKTMTIYSRRKQPIILVVFLSFMILSLFHQISITTTTDNIDSLIPNKTTTAKNSKDHHHSRAKNPSEEESNSLEDWWGEFWDQVQHHTPPPDNVKDLGDIHHFDTTSRPTAILSICKFIFPIEGNTKLDWLKTIDIQDVNDKNLSGGEQTIQIEESFCKDGDRPFTSLVQIIISELLYNHISSQEDKMITLNSCESNLNIYDEQTNIDPMDFNPFSQSSSSHDNRKYETIQQYIPFSNLNDLHELSSLDFSIVKNVCNCVFDNNHHPTIKEWLPCLFQNHQFQQAIFSSLKLKLQDAMQHLTEKNAQALNIPNIEDTSTAIVVLACGTEEDLNCDSLYAVPLYEFALDIPRHVKKIKIYVTPTCVIHDNCPLYAQALIQYCKLFFPQADIQQKIATSTAILTSELLFNNENHAVLLPPSHITVLPLIFRYYLNGDSVHPNIESLFIQLFPWLSTIFQNVKNDDNASLHHPIPMREIQKMDTNSFFDFLQQTPNSCQNLRGRVGKWIRDSNVKDAQYPFPLYRSPYGQADVHFAAIKHKKTKDVRMPTIWKWIDTLHGDSCQVQKMSFSSICEIFHQLQISKILFVGDEFAYQQTLSFWKILEDLPESFPSSVNVWLTEHSCPNVDWSFTLSYVRNERLSDTHTPPVTRDEPNCHGFFCYPWLHEYLQYDGRVVLVTSMGQKHNQESNFQTDFQNFASYILGNDQIDKKLVFITTSSPKHEECSTATNLIPYRNYQHFQEATTPRYFSSIKSDHFNDIVHRIIGNKLPILDIFPMTVLRPDGHLGDLSDNPCDTKLDKLCIRNCVDYSLPGPVDWWTHLLYSQLLDQSSKHSG